MRLLLTTALVTCLPVIALAAGDEHTELGAHEHGAGVFNVAIEGESVAMELEAPGADIVGFEHAAKSKKDKAAIKKAKATLKDLSKVVVLPAAAECKVKKASIELVTEGGDHDKHDDHDHGHEKKAEKHDDHDHDHSHKKKAKKHDDHDHDHGHKKKAKKHDDHDHGKEEAGHTEFHAGYELSCHHPEKLTGFTFAYFKTFKNSRELEVSITGPSGQKKVEATRKNNRVDLGGIM